MSYGMSAALQKAVYTQLVGDAVLAGLVGTAIYDTVPAGQVPGTYVALGPEEVRDRSDRSGGGAIHRFTISVISGAEGFAAVKSVAGAVSDALEAGLPALERGRLVGLWFEKASAKRTGKADRVRRIDLRFRARVEDS